MSLKDVETILERNYPFLCSAIITILLYFYQDKLNLDFDKLSTNSISVFGILIGFLITVLSLINTIENQYTRALKATEDFSTLTDYLKNTIWLGFYVIVLCMAHDFLIGTFIESVVTYIQFGILFLVVMSLLASYRFIRYFLIIILA